MNQQPDKFFRDKLQTYERTVSPGAWNRVSKNLNKKNKWNISLRVAAAVLILAAGTLLIYPSLRKGNNEYVSETNPSTVTRPPLTTTDSGAIAKSDAAPVQKDDNTAAIDKTPAAPRQDRINRDMPEAVKHQSAVKPLPQPEPRNPIAQSGNTSQHVAALTTGSQQPLAEVQVEEPDVVNVEVVRKKNVTIVFTAEEVNEKYLIKNQNAEATANQEQASGFKKLLDKAHDLKHNQDLLGSLRQKKNEILAMNFRNEKETTQND